MVPMTIKSKFFYFLQLSFLICLLIFPFKKVESKSGSIHKKKNKTASQICDRTASEDLDAYLDRFQLHLKKEYSRLIQDYFHKHRGIIANRRETELVVKVKIDSNGNVLSATINRSSDEEKLDQLIVDLISEKSPFPPPKKLCEDILDAGILVKFIVNNTTYQRYESYVKP